MGFTTRILSLLIVVLGAGAAAAPAARAQIIPSPYRFIETKQEAGAFAGFLRVDPGAFEFGPDDGPLLGVRYGIRVNGPITFEGLASYAPTTRAVINPNRTPGNRKAGEADVQLALLETAVQFNLVGERAWHGLGPYALAGGGIAFDLAGRQEIDNTIDADDRFEFGTTFVGHLGGGLRWIPGEHWVLRGDARFTLWRLHTPQGYLRRDRDLGKVEENEWTSGLALTLGIAFRF
ncbi:MAG: outer membrane beta-barrel protein [Gemmatimonadetes bacterium]|nr:outer membrane beta-barrel protein [Gemmatimonadota bacterium]